MTILEHSDRILASKPGETLLCCEPVSGVNMRAGGRIKYSVGAKFRVKFTCDDLIWVIDERARSVSFDREEMACLEREEES